jgi:hypothetical protein
MGPVSRLSSETHAYLLQRKEPTKRRIRTTLLLVHSSNFRRRLEPTQARLLLSNITLGEPATTLLTKKENIFRFVIKPLISPLVPRPRRPRRRNCTTNSFLPTMHPNKNSRQSWSFLPSFWKWHGRRQMRATPRLLLPRSLSSCMLTLHRQSKSTWLGNYSRPTRRMFSSKRSRSMEELFHSRQRGANPSRMPRLHFAVRTRKVSFASFKNNIQACIRYHHIPIIPKIIISR